MYWCSFGCPPHIFQVNNLTGSLLCEVGLMNKQLNDTRIVLIVFDSLPQIFVNKKQKQEQKTRHIVKGESSILFPLHIILHLDERCVFSQFIQLNIK